MTKKNLERGLNLKRRDELKLVHGFIETSHN